MVILSNCFMAMVSNRLKLVESLLIMPERAFEKVVTRFSNGEILKDCC